MSKYTVSIVQALKEWKTIDIKRLMCSISSQSLAHEIQLIVVFSAEPPEAIINSCNDGIADIKFISTPPEGIYEAFSIGVEHAEGDFIIFCGGDDFFMPGLSSILHSIRENLNSYPHVIAATVCFGDKRLLKPSRSKFAMTMKNWCQQGILYRRDIFTRYYFDPMYKIQADHKFNIEIIGSRDLDIIFCPEIVAYFSRSGVSQTRPDLQFWKDMPAIVSQNFGFIYGIVCHLRRWFGILIYGRPENRFKS